MLIGVSIFLLHEFYNPYLATAHSRTPQQLYPHHLCTPTRRVPYTHSSFTCTNYAHPYAESLTHTAALPAPTMHTHTQSPLHTQQLYLHHLCTPTRTLPYTPLHTQLSHLHTHPSSFTRTTCAHPYTYLLISTNINSP